MYSTLTVTLFYVGAMRARPVVDASFHLDHCASVPYFLEKVSTRENAWHRADVTLVL
jgi:hypothetical protein